MLLEEPSEFNLKISATDGGCVVNIGNEIVVLRQPDPEELRDLFGRFQDKLKTCMFDLFCETREDVIRKYGLLEENEKQQSLPYGLVVQENGQFTNLTQAAVMSGLADLGKITALNSKGRTRERMALRAGNASDAVLSLTAHEQRDLIKSVIEKHDIDDYLRGQTFRIGFKGLGETICALDTGSVDGFMAELADGFEQACFNPDVRGPGKRVRRRPPTVFAPLWFAMFLASEGVWLLPMRLFPEARYLAPYRLQPIAAWMSVPGHARRIATEVMEFGRPLNKRLVFNAFIATAVASDMWSMDRFCPYPLTILKDWVAAREGHADRGLNCNYYYFRLAAAYGVHVADRADFHVFHLSRRNAAGTSFRWCDDPTPRNTIVVSQLIGHPVTSVPEFVREWAHRLDELLPSFEVKYPQAKVVILNAWLAYLMTLPREAAPKSFRDIDREAHAEPFLAFIEQGMSSSESRRVPRTVNALKKCWTIVAQRERFFYEKDNPFDLEIQEKSGTPDPSNREAMPFDVWAVLTKLNYQDDYAFARGFKKKYWRKVTDPDTGEQTDIFWGAEARILDMIFCGGYRLMDARHSDSGEGDEYILDLDAVEYVENHLPTAEKGRQNGFLQLVWLDMPPRYVVGGWRIQDKSNTPKLVPHVEMRLARMIQEFAAIQARFNPVIKPVPFVNKDARHQAQNLKAFPHGFMLFRDVGDPKKFFAISEERCRAYFVLFCEWAQPILDAQLGYHFPLFLEGVPRFSIHDLRTTTVTGIVRAGHPLEVAQVLVGHANKQMTAHYVADQIGLAHEVAARRVAEREERAKLTDRELLEEAIKVDYRPEGSGKHDGLDMATALLLKKRTSVITRFDHGICPGGDCDKAGVWRHRACSRCPLRVTGPRYADGCAAQANILLFEFHDSLRRERELNENLANSERSGAISSDRNLVRKEQEFREHLLDDILAELKVHQGLEHLKRKLAQMGVDHSGGILIAPNPDFQAQQTSFSLVPAHELQLLHGIVGGELHPGTILTTPPLARERYRNLTREIARTAGLGRYMYRMDASQEEEFCRLVADKLIPGAKAEDLIRLVEGEFNEEGFPNLLPEVQKYLQKHPELTHA